MTLGVKLIFEMVNLLRPLVFKPGEFSGGHHDQLLKKTPQGGNIHTTHQQQITVSRHSKEPSTRSSVYTCKPILTVVVVFE